MLMQVKELCMNKEYCKDMVYFKSQNTRHIKVICKSNGHWYGMDLNGIPRKMFFTKTMDG